MDGFALASMQRSSLRAFGVSCQVVIVFLLWSFCMTLGEGYVLGRRTILGPPILERLNGNEVRCLMSWEVDI